MVWEKWGGGLKQLEKLKHNDSSAPNTGDSKTAVSEDFIDAVEARQAEEAEAAQAVASSSSRPRNRRIDFTAEADALVK